MLPSIILLVGSVILPETPNSLLERGQEERARQVLMKIRGTPNIDIELEDIRLAAQQSNQVRSTYVLHAQWCIALSILAANA